MLRSNLPKHVAVGDKARIVDYASSLNMATGRVTLLRQNCVRVLLDKEHPMSPVATRVVLVLHKNVERIGE